AQNITDRQDIDTLLGYFHDLGVVLHFADNPLLRDRVILKPAWATNAVYRIFDDDSIKAKAGRFSRQDCADIWNDPRYHHMHDVLIELMKNFRLVYEIGNTGELVAPQLLPFNTPTYDWDESQNSHMQLRYDAFMPKGIFWQFAVTLYRYIYNHDWVWRSGMVIRRGHTWAEVKEDLDQRLISLRFSGPSIPEFRAVIIDQLDQISQSYHQLHYDKMIPCQCHQCQNSNPPHFFKYSRLKQRQETGKKSTIECEISEADVPLRLLLEGFAVRDIVERLPDQKGDEPAPPPLSEPDNPAAPKPQPKMRTIQIFLASSSELKADREQFEIFISRKNKEYIKDGLFLELVIWEDFLNAMSKTRSQDEYNKAIASCDVFVLLAYTKVGQYTEEEFLIALETFKDSDKPLIFTYFKDAAINMSSITPEIMTLLNFKQTLSDMGHFYQDYKDASDLKHQFGEQLIKLLPRLTD
ncbi:COR domain-containing protein, partial [Sphaerothrix gracilis]|uniref:COR domain-containing protein n=1 Tax=Sphaerothrix gracilis TaxID=3151835 RepID=UPI0031FD72A9